ncbi:MAG: NAD-dependent epimerase/dehydratase family protein [Casimicrobiaceae bacterium]
MASPTERILVTGAGGFTGHHLCALLRQHGHRVIELTEHVTAHADEVQANLLDRASMQAAIGEVAPDRVVHLAAIAFPGHARVDEIYRTNLEGSLNLLDVLTERGHGRGGVLLASTATVYGAVDSPSIDENSPPNPGSHYAVSKLAMEQMARLFQRALPITVVRPFNYTGPGQREPYLVPKIVRHFAEGATDIELGNIEVTRDFLDVRSVVEMYARLMTMPVGAGQVVNICSGTGRTIRSIVTALEGITCRPMAIHINPKFVRVGEPQQMVGSTARLHKLIGTPRVIPFETTLRDMLQAQTA